MYIYISIYIYIYLYIFTYIHIYRSTLRVSGLTFVSCVRAPSLRPIFIYICLCLCLYIYIYTYIYIEWHISIYLSINILLFSSGRLHRLFEQRLFQLSELPARALSLYICICHISIYVYLPFYQHLLLLCRLASLSF